MSSIRIIATALGLAAIVACNPSPVMPGPPPGIDPLASVPSTRRLSFPSGPAVLHIWGHSLLTNGPFCGPVLGTPEGSSVSAVVQVAADDTGWTVGLESPDRLDRLELRIAPAGRSIPGGEMLTGVARGQMRDSFVIAPAAPRDLRVELSSHGPSVVEGQGSTGQPYFQGTITGFIRFTDSYGGYITCPAVNWSLWPFAPLPGL